MLNHIALQGRFTREPELRYTQSKIPVASFTLAVNRDVASQDGTRAADFIDCIACCTHHYQVRPTNFTCNFKITGSNSCGINLVEYIRIMA